MTDDIAAVYAGPAAAGPPAPHAEDAAPSEVDDPAARGMPAVRPGGRSIVPIALLALGSLASIGARAEPVGEVDTVFKLIGPDHKIVVDAYDDPKVGGVTCYVSRAKTGGLKGAVGLAEDTSDASIACRQVGPLAFAKPLAVQEEVFNERLSVLFKKLRVVRMVDKRRNTLVYLSYSDRVIEGSPKNAITAVPVDRAMPIPVR